MEMVKSGYRRILARELSNRVGRNPKYSLRAFARDLEVSPAHIARVMNNTRNLSMISARRIANKLFEKRAIRAKFLELVETELTHPETDDRLLAKKAEAIATRGSSAHQISDLDFQEICNWYSFAILDAVTLKNGPRTTRDVATFLGLPGDVAEKAVASLVSKNLLENKAGRLKKSHAYVEAAGGMPSRAIRSFHRQMLGRATLALENQEVHRRIFRGTTITIRRDKLQLLNEASEEFLARLAEISDSCGADADSLYQVNVQIFDLGKEQS